MEYIIENEFLKVVVDSHGAELKSVVGRSTDFEFMWQADPAVWGRTSPVLFPVVGKLKDDRLNIAGRSYHMTQHGFARDTEFECVFQDIDQLRFRLQSSSETLQKFPYGFVFDIIYKLEENSLSCTWEVKNPAAGTIFFSVGAHPGFNLKGRNMEDYQVLFSKEENTARHLLTGGLFNGETERIPDGAAISLSTGLFNKDAVVLKNLNSERISLKHKSSLHEISLSFEGFPYLGIWSPKGRSEFVCLEPWCGLADSVSGHTDISEKEGIEKLEAAGTFKRTYTMTFTA